MIYQFDWAYRCSLKRDTKETSSPRAETILMGGAGGLKIRVEEVETGPTAFADVRYWPLMMNRK